jgi:hypothetical protein
LSLSKEREEEIRKQLSELFDGMMRTLYSLEGSQFRIEVLAEPKIQKFIDAHAGVLDSTFKKVEMSDGMRKRLQRSDYIFSGMKTFHESNEAFPSLLDENGERKTFEAFLNDVRKIDNTYNSNYLRAEYNFVQGRLRDLEFLQHPLLLYRRGTGNGFHPADLVCGLCNGL